MKNFKEILGTVRFTLKKYSPEILMAAGIGGTVVSTVMACRGTLKCEQVINTYNKKMAIVDDTMLSSPQEYTEQDAKKDRAVITIQTGLDFVKLYGPAVTLEVASIACILGSFKIMKKRNVALMAAYKLVEEAFSKYRNKVRSELGVDKDHHFRYGTDVVEEQEVVTDPATGEEKTVKKERQSLNGVAGSMYARVFEDDKPDQNGSWIGSTQWSTMHDYNLSYLVGKEEAFNNLLISKGFITLNEVYDELGFPRTESGMIVGWRHKNGGDNYISFRPEDDSSWTFGGDGDALLVDFNVDGVIFDEHTARQERA